MELYELGMQYIEHADILSKRIHELNVVINSLNGADKIAVKQRITALYDDVARCRNCALILINYRRKGDNIESEQIQP